jgi:hypothetical protein
MATEHAVFTTYHFLFLILNFPFPVRGKVPFGGIENGKRRMEIYSNRTRRLHTMPFSIFNSQFSIPRKGERPLRENGKLRRRNALFPKHEFSQRENIFHSQLSIFHSPQRDTGAPETALIHAGSLPPKKDKIRASRRRRAAQWGLKWPVHARPSGFLTFLRNAGFTPAAGSPSMSAVSDAEANPAGLLLEFAAQAPFAWADSARKTETIIRETKGLF